ncbi:MAG: GNAT family protein [Eubacteriales bacterium]|nr:GNAT family protein [Eubacteriales bacterium]
MRYSEKYDIRPMDEGSAAAISTWVYPEPYAMYSFKNTDAQRAALLDGSYWAVFTAEGELSGYLCCGKSAQVPFGHFVRAYDAQHIDIGLGMAPQRCGRKKGYGFVSAVVKFAGELCPDCPLRLTVATFNRRAIHLYESLGFVKVQDFVRTGPGKPVVFQVMTCVQ